MAIKVTSFKLDTELMKRLKIKATEKEISAALLHHYWDKNPTPVFC